MTGSKMAALVVLMVASVLLVYLVVGPRRAAAGKPAAAASTATVKGQTYEDAGLGFSFEYPADWIKADTAQLGAEATFFGPRRSDFTMGLDVRSERNPTALAVYVNRSIKKVLPEYKTNFKLLEEETLQAAGLEAVRVVYSYRQGDFDLINVQVVYGLGDLKVILTFFLLSEYFEELRPAVEQTISSFRPL